MELRQLAYFVAVAEELHFGRAAERVGMTQPPLSQQIRKLEEELGVRLFERSSRRVELSDAGRVYLEGVRRVFEDLRHAEQMARKAQTGDVGRLEVGFVGSATYDVLPNVIRQFQERHPQVELVLREMATPAQVEALLEGEIDLGFLRPPAAHPALDVRTVRRDQCVAVVPATHGLARHQAVRMEDLRDERLVLVSRSIWPGLYDSIADLSRAAGFQPQVRLEVTEVQTAVGLVAAGLGVSILPGSTQHVHTRDVRYLPMVDPAPEVEMALAWRRDNLSPALARFREVVREGVVAHT
ncbi:MAG: LysR family transcriptional regulator [Alicyclobacillus sp.]|nr:LysR family transcriptional regulator [Alicyclobacillus sp.]